MKQTFDRAAWLEERRTGIGGSDVAAILGISEYDGPYTVWADKLGLLPEKDDTEAMRQGRDLEDYVAQRFCEATGKRVRRVSKMLRSPKHPFMLANIDRDIVGESAGLECKTTSIFNISKVQGQDFPAQYYCQCVHYLTVTNVKRWYLAVLILNQGFYVFQATTIKEDVAPEWCTGSVYIDKAEMDALIEAECDFWSLVKNQTPPPVDGLESTRKALHHINPMNPDLDPVSIVEHQEVIDELEELKAQERSVKKAITERQNTLLAVIGEAPEGRTRTHSVSRTLIKRGEYIVKPSEYYKMNIKEIKENGSF